MEFTGTVKRYDEDEGKGVIVRDRDQHEIVVTSRGLGIGVTALFEDDRVEFDVDLSVMPQARNVCRI
jgi:cold shock CspA family protein